MALDIFPVQNSVHLTPEAGRTQVAHEAAQQRAARPVTPAELESTIRDLGRVSAAFNRRLTFTVNEKLDQVVVKVVDADTDKVVREIPAAELQHVYERIREVVGLLFDERA